MSRKYDAWVQEQPEIIAYHEESKILRAKADEEFKKTCFVGMGLANPGTLVEIEHPEYPKITCQYLIGNINTSAGVCDDCRDFENDAIVKRYMVLLEEGESDVHQGSNK